MTSTTVQPGFRATKPRTGDGTSITSTYTALSQRVREAGLLGRTHTYYMVTLGVLTLALAGCVAGFVLLGDSWFQLLIAGALGIVMTQFAFVTHEAAHRQVFESGPVNDRVGRLLANGLVGISYSWWMTKHTRHHANPNKIGKDPDIDMDVIVFTPESAAEPRGRFFSLIHRFQGWLFFPLLTLEGLNLHVVALRSLFASKPSRERTVELALIITRLTVVTALIFWALPLGLAFAFIGVELAVFGVYMGASFAPNHKGMKIVAADEKLDFLSKQVLTSRNIRGGWFMNVLMGGLNFQIEHHLFPSMPRPHLIKARLMVREHCQRLGMPYTETNLFHSYMIVVRYLNEVGLKARDPFDCPMFHQLRGR
ncbi:fatty acid desaturase [Sediminihabitans luteus]|uniref:Fatty acid desaturase n=1 Tax=Sediminihabitans luteus TaxID=1138585 RepID=A0A2M9D166_9CELL|nr:acyl-CoA desaturase [Sediminihabitans luteus]PJJ77823.1 fatty acid desaturase [Sediminihabitans luteus]GII99819.1 fatty acid desaturase [Sediminihabitans luteus]